MAHSEIFAPTGRHRALSSGALRITFALLATIALIGITALPATAAPPEATFERTLTVTGSALQLSVSTGAGNIQLTRGSDNQIHIVGHVKANWQGSEDEVRQVADHPPIEQTGNIVRIGQQHQQWQHISISYEIEAPASAFLNASSGSGNIDDTGVGENASLHTGSGNVHATGLSGGFSASTGSGNVYAEQSGEGDVKATTGSGNIELRNLHGGLTAHTGSGGIKLSGTPASLWHVQTGSGNVELWPGSSGFTLNASTGSGNIRTDHPITGQIGNHHHVTGTINGGGPDVHVSTGSGDIRVH
ncbi:MAG TPA: DUF4097 family beta strand repeat-containing protein [Terracidiphilus sp.]